MSIVTWLSAKLGDALKTWSKTRTEDSFLVYQTIFFATWILLNTVPFLHHFDPLFICLNLILSLESAYTGPILIRLNRAQEEASRKSSEMTEERVQEILNLAREHDHDIEVIMSKLK